MMKSLVITVLLFLTLSVVAKAQENAKTLIHDVQVKSAAGTATVYSQIHLNSVVGGNAVRFPFIVTEVYVMENGKWQLSTLAFTRTLGE